MKTQAQYYQQHQALTDDELLYEIRGLNAYFMVRQNGYDGPTRADPADEQKALEQLLEERGLENPGMQFGDIFRLKVPPEAGIPQAEGPLFADPKSKGKASFLDEKIDIEKEFRTKGIIQIIVGVILAFFCIGLSLDMKGFLFYGAIFGGIALIVVGIMNVSSYQKLKR